MGGYIRAVSEQRHGKHIPAATDTNITIEDLCLLCGQYRDIIRKEKGSSFGTFSLVGKNYIRYFGGCFCFHLQIKNTYFVEPVG
jgi:hypothetical protein